MLYPTLQMEFGNDDSDDTPAQSFDNFESALESMRANGLDETFDGLVRYFSVPGREKEIGALFEDLDFHGKIRFIELLMSEVFEGEGYHHQPSMIVYRKHISEGLRVTKGEIRIENALSEARIGRPDPAIAFFRIYPYRIKSFLAELNNGFPEESEAVTLNLVGHLLTKIQKPAD